jgi:hypothetical protein
MSENQNEKGLEGEEPKVFSIAQFPAPGGTDIDRRSFFKSAAAFAGTAAVVGLLSGCETEDGEHPFVDDEEDLPGEPGTVPRGSTGMQIQAESGHVRHLPVNSGLPAGWTCTCNTVTVPSCSCDGHVSSGSGGHTYYITYWYPN